MRDPERALAVGGLPESIVDGETGMLAQEPTELVTGECARSWSGPELRERLGAGAERRARTFTWERVGGDLPRRAPTRRRRARAVSCAAGRAGARPLLVRGPWPRWAGARAPVSRAARPGA